MKSGEFSTRSENQLGVLQGAPGSTSQVISVHGVLAD